MKPEMALAEIDRAIAAGVRFGCALADAGYGLSASFRNCWPQSAARRRGRAAAGADAAIGVLMGWSESDPQFRSWIDTFVEGLAAAS